MVHTHTQICAFKLSFSISKIPPLKQKGIHSDNAVFNALIISKFTGISEDNFVQAGLTWKETLTSEGSLHWWIHIHLINCSVSYMYIKKSNDKNERSFSRKVVSSQGFCFSWFSEQGLFEGTNFFIKFSQWIVLL